MHFPETQALGSATPIARVVLGPYARRNGRETADASAVWDLRLSDHGLRFI